MAKRAQRYGNPGRQAAYEKARARKLSHKAALTNVALSDRGLAHYERLAEVLERLHGPDFRDLAHGTFTYGCDQTGCDWEHTVWLGLGVEGPKDLRDRKLYIPSPFYCGSCPTCGGRLRHVRPADDARFITPLPIPEGAARFVVPTPRRMRVLADFGGADYSDPQRSSR